MKVLLDTDIGSDIDDAVCLAYLLANPRCELLGITTVSGEPHLRAQMASALCEVAGKSIPIATGHAAPLHVAQRQTACPQATALARWPHATRFPDQAVDLLRDTIRRHPGEIALLTIGPLTNIARLFAADPEVPHLLRALVIMGGRFTDTIPGAAHAEWNILCDPHAADIVYRAPVAIHRSVGLDVTLRVQLSPDEVRRRFQAPLLRPVLDFAEVWFAQQPHIVFHDPLAAAALFNDTICEFARGDVSVHTLNGADLGMTSWTPNATGGVEVALTVNPPAFFGEFFSAFPERRHD